MGKYTCRCPSDDEGRLLAEDHDDRCPAGQLQDWAWRRLRLLEARCRVCGEPFAAHPKPDHAWDTPPVGMGTP